MDPIEYVRALRRRWWIVAAAFCMAVLIGFASASGASPSQQGQISGGYEATAVMLATPGNSAGINSVETLTALVPLQAVAELVAKDIGFTGDPTVLSSSVSAIPDNKTGLLSITANQPTAAAAKKLADAYASDVVKFAQDRQSSSALARAQQLASQMAQLRRQIDTLNGQLNGQSGPGATLTRLRRDALESVLSVTEGAYQTAIASAANVGGPILLQAAAAHPATSVGSVSFAPPRSRKSRVLLAAVAGLLLGIALALVVERFDSRIRTKQEAERYYGLPVLSEIPALPWTRRREAKIESAVHPSAASADAFRLLGAGIIRPSSDESPNGDSGHRPSPHTILITSATPGEGKTTVAANLAVTFAELGKKVLILSCDFHRPRVHQLFGVPNDSGLSEALRTNGSKALDGRTRFTAVKEISLVPSGSRPPRPAELLSSPRMQQILEEAKEQADLVLLDTSPILTAGDTTFLFPEVDAVIMVTRAGKTSSQIAERSSELLKRLGAPVVGVVLNGSRESPMPRKYIYRYH